MTTTILLRDGRNIGGIIPDVVVEETHLDSATITEHAIEQGAPITDHAYLNPAELTMRVGWSTSSLALGGVLRGIQAGTLLQGKLSTVRDVYDALLKLQASRQPFDVSTGKRLYKSMLIKSLSITTDASSENALVCSIVLREVLLVKTKATRMQADAQRNPEKTAPTEEVGVIRTRATALTELDLLRSSGGPR